MVSQYTLASGTLAWQRDIAYLGAREVAEFDAAGMHITHTDHLDSPRMMTNAAGKSEGFQKYLPFGGNLDLIGFRVDKGFTNTRADGRFRLDLHAKKVLRPPMASIPES